MSKSSGEGSCSCLTVAALVSGSCVTAPVIPPIAPPPIAPATKAFKYCENFPSSSILSINDDSSAGS